MKNREIDFYIKNLSINARQEILSKMIDGINPIIINYMLEKEEDYPSFKKRGLTDDEITIILKNVADECKSVNKMMMNNRRYPLFEDIYNTYETALRHKELLRKKDENELIKIFGCSWEEYIPKEYIKEFER